MKFDTDLRKAKDLGSAKKGTHHWIAQRVSAIALIPLGIWFISLFALLVTAPYAETRLWLSSPWAGTLAILFVSIMIYHGDLGMQVIWEDYIHHTFTKWSLIILTKILSMVMAVAAILSILKIFLR